MVEQNKPVQRRFSKHRDKGMKLLLVGILPTSLLLLCVSYWLRTSCFSQYGDLQNDYSVGAMFIAYPLLYILWELFTRWKYRKEYNDYCSGYSVRQMNEWAAYLPDAPVRFHREAKRQNRFLLWFGVILIIGSFIWSAVDLTKQTTSVDNTFDPQHELEYDSKDSEAILMPVGIVLGCAFALAWIIHGTNHKSKKDWIQVTEDRLELYKDWALADTIEPDDVSLIIVHPIRTRFGLTGGHITLFGKNRQELITVPANAENIDLVIDLLGRNKLLVKR